MKGIFTFHDVPYESKKLSKEELIELWRKHKEREAQIAEEQECTFSQCLDKGLDTFKIEYMGNRTMDDIYRDMAPEYTRIFDRTIFACYLFIGIQRLDTWMAHQIQMREKCPYRPHILAKMIMCNYHLHNVIKTNLLENLRTYSGYDGINEHKQI